jgi:formate hydrogenlyase transcriptional activator
LHDLARRLGPFFEFNYLSIILHDETKKMMRLHLFETDEPALRTLPTEVNINGSMAGWVWQNQQVLITGDVTAEKRFKTTQILRDYPLKSLCLLPLSTAHQKLGVLSIGCNRKDAYGQIDLEFARHVAIQIAAAVESQYYQEQLKRARDRSQFLLEINNMLVSNLDLPELLRAISLCLRRVIPHDLASLALYDEASNRLRVTALEFPDNEDLFVKDELVPLIGNPGGQAFTTRMPVISNTEGLEDNPFTRRFIIAGVKSGCTVPLISHDKALGVLSVASLRDNAFTSDHSELLMLIGNQVAIAVENALSYQEIKILKNQLQEAKLYLEEEIRTEHNFAEIIGNDQALKRVLQQVETVAATDSTVIIYGETGTGKELIARAIHNLSKRRDSTLVKVNCAAIPTGLLESEMFGHEKGAFTGAIERRIGRLELAHRGTIFLDEVGDVPLELQSKLLRVLQEHEFERLGSSRTIRVDLRIVAATNCNLAQMVAEKRFRSDLYYRLNVFPIAIPPLRERSEDIPLLVNFFAQKFAHKMKKRIEKIPKETMTILCNYQWPGNIRELENLIERSVILTRGALLEAPVSELRGSIRSTAEQPDQASTLETIERNHILNVLRQTNWVIGGPNGAAARLGLNRSTLNHRMRKLGITRPPLQQ